MKTIWKIIFTIFLFIMNIIYSSVIYEILQLFGIDITTYSTNLKIFYLILIDLSFMIILYLIYRKKINKDIINYKNNFKEYFKFGLKYWLAGLVIMMISNIIISMIYTNQSTNEEIVQSILDSYPIYMIFSASISAPFVEELIYRKSIRDIFDNKYNYLYIIVSGLAFGFVHTLANVTSTMELLYIIPYGVMGSMFAYIYTKTDNILVPMSFHFIHNTITIIISLMPIIGG